jgi:DNA-binding beta-propeller fold protein YncE
MLHPINTTRKGPGTMNVRRAILLVSATVALTAMAPTAASAATVGAGPGVLGLGSRLGWLGSSGAGLGGAAGTLGGSPGSVPVVNPSTGTLYMPVQCTNPSTNATCDATAVNFVDVISTAHCPAGSVACPVVAKAIAGWDGIAATLDQKSDTVYVGDGQTGHYAVSVIDGAKCNATVTTGCSSPLATIPLSDFPADLALDPATGTLYVAGLNTGEVFAINAGACNTNKTTGCGQPPKTITDSLDPDVVAVDVATDTVYAANVGTGSGDTVSVINGATCNATVSTGCGQTPRTVTVGSGPQFGLVDQATDTVYIANYNDGTVSVLNGALCNATTTSGCGHTPPAVFTGSGTAFLALDDARHTLFVLNQTDDTMSEIDIQTCKGASTSGCPTRARDEQATFNPPAGYNPTAFGYLPATGTAYLVNSGGEDYLAADSVARCSAIVTTGCRIEAPTVPNAEYLSGLDKATETIYASSQTKPEIDVINGATCTAAHLAGCAPIAEIPMADPQANLLDTSFDDVTHTLYAVNPYSGTVAVINTAHCNATDTTRCATPPKTWPLGQYPSSPLVDPDNGTVYIVYGNPARIAVINANTCNAQGTTGCGHGDGSISLPGAFGPIALSADTDTLYAPSYTAGTVAVIDGASCSGTDHSGCGHLAATVHVGTGPVDAVADDQTHTVYVANDADGDLPGTASIINTATCNGFTTTGCAEHYPTIATGRSPFNMTIDTTTDYLYVSDGSSAAVSIINAAACNSRVTTGCATPSRQQPVSSFPFGITVDPTTKTVYANDGNYPNNLTTSVFAGAP